MRKNVAIGRLTGLAVCALILTGCISTDDALLKPVLDDTRAYNQKNPNAELTKILNETQAKPATH